jgi:hypothetical protein
MSAERGIAVGAMERMRDELSRARRRGGHVVMLEQVRSPMDLNPTLEVSAALIADCARQADRRTGAAEQLIDDGMRQAANGTRARRDIA